MTDEAKDELAAGFQRLRRAETIRQVKPPSKRPVEALPKDGLKVPEQVIEVPVVKHQEVPSKVPAGVMEFGYTPTLLSEQDFYGSSTVISGWRIWVFKQNADMALLLVPRPMPLDLLLVLPNIPREGLITCMGAAHDICIFELNDRFDLLERYILPKGQYRVADRHTLHLVEMHPQARTPVSFKWLHEMVEA